MSEIPQQTPPLGAPDAAGWARALLTLDLALEACRATAAGTAGKPAPAPTLERMTPRGVPRRLWRTCVSLGVADLWQRLATPRRPT